MHNKQGPIEHIVLDVSEQEKATRWYDNPDISDFMFALFSRNESPYDGVCLHTYDKEKKVGFNRFKLKENKWIPEEKVESLEGRIVYHPILTVSTKSKAEVKAIFENVLDGIDKNENGLPSVIIIPILMNTSHFGTLAIKPYKAEDELIKYEVYYFNSLGTLNPSYEAYSKEEKLIFKFLKKRYGEKNTTLVHNNTERWQIDGNQCGPYAIWFVKKIAKLVRDGNLTIKNADTLFRNRWEMGVFVDVDNNFTKHGEEHCKQVRNDQAKLLEGLTTNFSPALFIQVKHALQHEIQDLSSYVFTNLCLQKPWNNSQKKIEIDDKWVRDLWGIDLFELQNEFKELIIEYLKTKDLDHLTADLEKLELRIEKKLPEPPTNIPDNPNAHRAAFSAVGAVIGMALSASAIVTGGALGAVLGISASHSNTFMSRE